MSAQFAIRSADGDDFDWIIARHGALYAAEFGFDARFERRIAGMVRDLRARDDGFTHFLMAQSAGERVGSIAVSALWEDDGVFLNFVLVEPEYRGRGVAEALMTNALEHARASGRRFARLETYSVLSAARRLYERLGFEIVAVDKDMTNYGCTFDREFWELRL